jgi:hypothetical protein
MREGIYGATRPTVMQTLDQYLNRFASLTSAARVCRQLVLYPDGCDHEHTGVMGVFLKCVVSFPVATHHTLLAPCSLNGRMNDTTLSG